MDFTVLTLFPEMIKESINYSILKRALENKIINLNCINIRDFSENKHNNVDDYPYGGGCGMVMQPEPIYRAYLEAKKQSPNVSKVIYMTPQGKPFNQKMAQDFTKEESLIILCGHYEGVDERIIEEIVTEQVSLGDYVLTGGELPALILIDAISRLIPGVLGKEESFQNETFADGLLEYPLYTRPPEFMGRKVPDVLISGHHQKVSEWRKEKSLERTKKMRPDLLD